MENVKKILKKSLVISPFQLTFESVEIIHSGKQWAFLSSTLSSSVFFSNTKQKSSLIQTMNQRH